MADATCSAPRRSAAERSLAKLLAAAFVLYGLIAIVFLATNVPPFQLPDEFTHFARAAQVADGGLVARRFATVAGAGATGMTAGGWIDPAISRAAEPFIAVYQPDRRAMRSMWQPRIHWSGARVLEAFPSTAVYPPVFYAPAALGILVGRISRMTVLETLTVSRLLTGVASLALGAAAIACAGGAAVWLFAILTLPMSLLLMSSPSQDALTLGCSALAGALLVRGLRQPNAARNGTLAALAVLLTLVGMARPPYGALALLPLALWRWRLRDRLLAAAAIACGVLAWSAIAAATALTNLYAGLGTDPPAQIARLLADPLDFVRAAWATTAVFWVGWCEQVVGWLFWIPEGVNKLPQAYYPMAWAMLGVAAVAAMTGRRGERPAASGLVAVAAGIALAVLALFLVAYVSWTPPGAPVMPGIQGRYFLPLALVGTPLLPAFGERRLARLHRPLVVLAGLFPLVSLGVLMHAVVLRYYLQ